MSEFFQRIMVKEKIFFLIVLLGISFVLILDIAANKAFSSSYRFVIFLLLFLNFLIYAASTSDNVPDEGKGISVLMFMRIIFSIILLVIYLPGAMKFDGDSVTKGILYFTMLALVVSLLLDFLGAMKLMKHNRVGKVIAITLSIVMFYTLLINYLTLIPKTSTKDLARSFITKNPNLRSARRPEEKSQFNKYVNIVKGVDKKVEKVGGNKKKASENDLAFNDIKEHLEAYVVKPNSKPLFQRTRETRKIGMIAITAPEPTPVNIAYGLMGDIPELNRISTLFPLGKLIPN